MKAGQRTDSPLWDMDITGRSALHQIFKLRSEGFTTPCQVDPTAWDPYNPERETGVKANERMHRAARACMGCPMFQPCDELRKSQTYVSGVLAGRMHNTGVTGRPKGYNR